MVLLTTEKPPGIKFWSPEGQLAGTVLMVSVIGSYRKTRPVAVWVASSEPPTQ